MALSPSRRHTLWNFLLLALVGTIFHTVQADHSHCGVTSTSVAFAPRAHVNQPKTRHDVVDAANSRVTFEDAIAIRGGASENQKALAGALYFIVLDVIFRKIFAANDIAFPSQLGGCLILFALLVLADIVRPGVGESAFQMLNPGANLLAKWLPVFFVPGLALLPLAPSIGSSMEIVKVLSVVIIGWFFTLLTTTYAVLGLRSAQGVLDPAADIEPIDKRRKSSSKKEAFPAPAPVKAFSDETMDFLTKGFVIFAALSVAATRLENEFAVPLRTIFLLFTTVGSYVFGARLPSAFTKIVHPLVTSTIFSLFTMQLTGLATRSTYLDVLRSYKVGSLEPMKMGAGDILLFLLGPSVVSLAAPMYSRKKLMKENFLVVMTSTLISSFTGLFGTALFVRAINLGGSLGRVLRLSMLSRNVTTALAIPITSMLGGDVPIACVVVVLTGVLGATYGRSVLDAVEIKDPVSRGLGVGASSQGLGVASMAVEPDAFPFAAISMVLTAVCSTSLVSIPAVKNFILAIVGGTQTLVEAATEAAPAT